MTVFFDKVIFNKTKIPVLNEVLDVTQLRQGVITNNVANVSTKGYRKKSVALQEYLNSFMRKPAVKGQTIQSHHITIPKPWQNPVVYQPETRPNDTGLNNVDIDQEMSELTENHLLFNVGSHFLTRSFKGLKEAITGRSQ